MSVVGSAPVSIRPRTLPRPRVGPERAASLVDAASRTSGRALDREARSALEPGFGHDFSRVRVHADGAADEAARAVGAAAFALGDHVFFTARAGRPERDRALLAHELAHVVQSRTVSVEGGPGPGSYRMSRPGDRWEHAAGLAAAAALDGNAATGAMAGAAPGARSRVGSKVIQRFLAGEDGHGGVEEKALQDAGFSHAEYQDTYYGNWLRDFSQQVDDPMKRGAAHLIALGEFGRNPSEEAYGGYLPSEHVDNPAGGRTLEDPLRTSPTQGELDKDKRLSQEQKNWVAKQTHDPQLQATLGKNSKNSGLPVYIERGKEHVRWKLKDAADRGRTPTGLLALGNGLHAVEDYFAHSNFVEVALSQMLDPGDPVLSIVHDGKVYPGVDPTALGGIVTGTSAPGAGDDVGKAEFLRTELRNHQDVISVMTGLVRCGGVGVAGGAVFGLLGGMQGLLTGAGQGAASGWRKGHGFWSRLGHGIAGFFKGAVKGAGHGFVRGWKAGWGLGNKVGDVIGKVTGWGPLGWLTHLAGTAAASPLVALESLSDVLLDRHETRAIESASRRTITEGAPLPTHSQIAKDNPDHPLHNAAARLAYRADYGIATAMKDVWAGKAGVGNAQGLVDTYMMKPVGTRTSEDWWKADLRQKADEARAKVLAKTKVLAKK